MNVKTPRSKCNQIGKRYLSIHEMLNKEMEKNLKSKVVWFLFAPLNQNCRGSDQLSRLITEIPRGAAWRCSQGTWASGVSTPNSKGWKGQ